MLLLGANAGKCGGRKPLRAGRGDGLAFALVGEESEDPILPDRAADAAAKLVVTVFIAEQAARPPVSAWLRCGIDCLGPRRTVPTLIRIQSRTGDLGKKAAMKVVGSALRGDFGDRAREAAIFSIVGIGDDFDVADRVFAGSNDRRSTPDGAHRADAVDAIAVGIKLAAVGVCRSAIFRSKDTAGMP
jgi:hypothetical protein